MKPDAFWQQIEQELAKPAGDRDPSVFEALRQRIDDEMRMPTNERNWHATEAFGQWLASKLKDGDPWDISMLLPDCNQDIPFQQPAVPTMKVAASIAPESKPNPQTVAIIRQAQERHDLAARYGVASPDAHSDIREIPADLGACLPEHERQKLPLEQWKRLTVALQLAAQESEGDTRRIDQHWKEFIIWLREHQFFATDASATRQAVLDRAQFLFPLFFKHPRPEQH